MADGSWADTRRPGGRTRHAHCHSARGDGGSGAAGRSHRLSRCRPWARAVRLPGHRRLRRLRRDISEAKAMSVLLDAAAALLMLAGAAFILIAAVGVARLPDIFVRMHAATKAAVFGVGLLLLGTAFAFGEPGVWVRVAAAILFLIFTTPIAAHALARASYAAGAPLWRGTVVDQLAEAPTDQVGGFKRASMTGPAALQRSAGKTVGTTEEESMTILSFDARNGESRHAPRTRTDGQPHLRRILVGLFPGEEGRATIDHAIRLARQTGAELV